MSAGALAFAAAALGVAGGLDLAAGLAARAQRRVPALAGPLRAIAETFTRAGSEGRQTAAAERRRLLTVASVAAFAVAAFAFGPKAGLIGAALAPTAASRLLRARRARYRRAVDAGAAEIAGAIADALSGGHSLRGALLAAAESLEGPPRNELQTVACELRLGMPTGDALDAMRLRIASPSIDLVVAGALMQRRTGGDLARLLRDCARTFEDEARLRADVRAATTQARFTGLVVVLLPLGGAALAELGSPGFVAHLLAFPLSAWLLGMAIAMQIAAAWAIRRLSRSRA